MPIKRIEISGYRSLKNVSWTPGKLNLIIGPNGSGKSNLLSGLELLHKAALGKQFPDAILQEGGLGQILWNGTATEVNWSLTQEVLDENQSKSLLTYQLAVAPLPFTGGIRIARELLADYSRVEAGESAEPIKFLEKDLLHGLIYLDATHQEMIDFEKTVPADQALLSTLSYPTTGAIPRSFWTALMLWAVYQDRQVHRQALVRQAAVARVEKFLDSDGQNLIPVLHTLYTGDRKFEQLVDKAMSAAFGPEYENLLFPSAADQRVQLRIRWRSLKTAQSAADLSDGTIRFLMLLCILGAAGASSDELIAIDEPEVGLHPRMFPIIAELAAAAAERTTVILTTHSDQFLDSCTALKATTTVAESVDGETRLTILDEKELSRRLKEYSLGALFRSGELEDLA
ncbi:MAG TPA: AAA family ATPase [Candidatus Binataceae bacterium]|nr:AAA family ATPase [Candidatus Binataceae bacterium]